MKTTKILTVSIALFGLFMLNTASAALVQNVSPYQTSYQPTNGQSDYSIIERYTDDSFDLVTDPVADYEYLISYANPGAVDDVQLQLAFDAAAATGNYAELVGYTVEDFVSSSGYFGGDAINSFFDDILTEGHLEFTDGTTIGGLMIKSGALTYIALFTEGVSEVWFQTFVQQGISHIAIFNLDSRIPEVPVPAALWLFGPALLGFMGLRRKAKTTIA